MKTTAKQFAKSPLEAYRRADRGEEVIVEHARYPDIEFRLTAKKKRHQFSVEEKAEEIRKIKGQPIFTTEQA